MKLGFYVSNNATTLKNILIFSERKKMSWIKKIEFILIDNNINNELRSICKRLNILLIEENLQKISSKSKHMSELLLKISIDYAVDNILIYCDKLLKGEILKKYENKIINFHPSLLPSFKGLYAIDQALDSNAFLFGNTSHLIDDKVDEGIIIMQSILPRKFYKNYNSVLELQIYMSIQIIIWLVEKRIEINNSELSIKGANYNPNYFIPNLEEKELINDFEKKYLREAK